MLYRRIDFEPQHARMIEPQAAQANPDVNMLALIDDPDIWGIASKLGHFWTGTWAGKVVCCHVITPGVGDRGFAACMLDRCVNGPILRAITRDCRELLDAFSGEFKIMETTVREDFDAGHRWARLLGFKRDGERRVYDAFGNNHAWYVRTRSWD